MRDERGRYNTMKAIEANGPDSARGCGACAFGIVLAPELTGAASFYLERLVQAVDGDITFCTCQAGQHYRVSLANRYRQLTEEAKKDTRMVDSARNKSHPDIDSTRAAMQAVQALRVPTVHMAEPVREAVPA